MKHKIFGVLFASLFLFVACSKDDKDETPNLVDLNILKELTYWKLDSVVHWYNGQAETFNLEDDDQINYINIQDDIIYTKSRVYNMHYDTINYTFVGNNIVATNDDTYFPEVVIKALNRQQMKWSITQRDVRVASDSAFNYLSPISKQQYDDLDTPR